MPIDWSQQRIALMEKSQGFSLPPKVTLPSLPRAVTSFMQACEAPDADIVQLAKILETDAGLTAALLRMLNSSKFGLRNPINTVRHAIATLGLKRVKTFVMTTGVELAVNGKKSKLINLKQFWGINLERATLASKIAGLLTRDADTAFAACMLCDFLLPTLTNDMCDVYVDYMTQLGQRGHANPVETDLCRFERQQFGWDHAEAAAFVLHDWGFPDDVIVGVHQHHRGMHVLADSKLGRTNVASLALANLIPDPLRQSPGGLDQLSRLSRIWPAFNIENLAEQVRIEVEEMTSNTTLDFPLHKRVEKFLTAKSQSAESPEPATC